MISRRDFQPFGEEIARAGYGTDDVRQKFTTYERDDETSLDFAKARMHNFVLGRFSSPDPLMASAKRILPQTWNRYTYVLNNPLNLVDPSGMVWGRRLDKDGQFEYQWFNGKLPKKGGWSVCAGDCLILADPSIGGRKLGYAIRLDPNGNRWDRIVPIDVPNEGRSWIAQKDLIALNAISAGALCSLSAGLACPGSLDKEISDKVATAADLVQLAFLVKSLIKLGFSVGAIAVILRKDATDIAKIAAEVAKDFGNLQCLPCAETMIKELAKNGIKGTLRELKSSADVIVKAGQNAGEAISVNGRHFGVQVGEMVYDVHYPQGIPISDWAKAYESIGEIVLVPQ